jgi:hypothetical protein
MFAEVVSVVANLMDRLASAVKGDCEGAEEAIEGGRQLIITQLEAFECTSE